MGAAVGPGFRWLYVTNVQRTPWLYQFFFDSLWRWRWFADASKRFVAAWAGRRLRTVVADFRPDLILTTYPLGTDGIAWLRARGETDVPVASWISDFAPHPFWVYRDVDVNVVMHKAAVDPAVRCVPEAEVGIGQPPVSAQFTPGSRDGARKKLNLPTRGFLAMVSCGSLGFGSVRSAVTELLQADARVGVVVVCGHNDELRAKVTAIAPDDPRLIVYGWTDQMPHLLRACDVLVTNAGGVTSLEAMACQRAVLMYQPIAAHGEANARLMADAGLAQLCAEPGSLKTTVQHLLAHPAEIAAMERASRNHTEHAMSIDDQLERVVDSGHSCSDGRRPRTQLRSRRPRAQPRSRRLTHTHRM
jgi:UDP-N-acetylglucosamine:LPS N-acetylglucosamine transferase